MEQQSDPQVEPDTINRDIGTRETGNRDIGRNRGNRGNRGAGKRATAVRAVAGGVAWLLWVAVIGPPRAAMILSLAPLVIVPLGLSAAARRHTGPSARSLGDLARLAPLAALFVPASVTLEQGRRQPSWPDRGLSSRRWWPSSGSVVCCHAGPCKTRALRSTPVCCSWSSAEAGSSSAEPG